MDSSAGELRGPQSDSADWGSTSMKSADHAEQTMERNNALRDIERDTTYTESHIAANEIAPPAEGNSSTDRGTVGIAAEDESNLPPDRLSLVDVGINEENATRPAALIGDAASSAAGTAAAFEAAPTTEGDNGQVSTDANPSQAQEQEASNKNGAPCKICFTNLAPEELIYLNCGCLYCVECLNDHFRSGLANRASYPPRCCDNLPIDVEAIQGFLNDQNMVRYTTVQEEFAAERPIYCANRECAIDFIGDSAEISVQGNDRMLICYGCALETCVRCRELRDAHTEHEGVFECPDSLAIAEVKDVAEENKWRRCPGCGFLVEKIYGCDHMICDCRMEFHYVCGKEYWGDGPCSCAFNHDMDDDEDWGDEGGWDENLVDQLPPNVQDDFRRPAGFPFEANQSLEHIMEDAEGLLVGFVEGDDAGVATGATRAADEEVVAGGGARQTAGAQEVAQAGRRNHPVEGEEHEVEAQIADPIEEDSDGDDMDMQTAAATLRTALAGFRNATEELRTAATLVVSGRRRRAERALRALERADRLRGHGAFRGGRGIRGRGRGRGGRRGEIVAPALNLEGGDGEEQGDLVAAGF